MAKDEGKLFNAIAPIYGLFFKYQVRYYRKIVAGVGRELALSQYTSVIDVGCGTGALCQVLADQGFKVTGIDLAQRMVDIASQRLNNSAIKLLQADVLKGIPFADNSFDLAMASYVVHGLKQSDREKVYHEMARVAKQLVIFHDYNQKRAIHTTIAEWLERGDYFNFIKSVPAEMTKHFQKVEVMNVTPRAAWYLCTPKA